MRLTQVNVLLNRLIDDIHDRKCEFTCNRDTGLMICDWWSGLKSVWVGGRAEGVRITFWLDGGRSVRLDSTHLPTSQADQVLLVWTMIDPDLENITDVVAVTAQGRTR